jgi:hypothetical protein
MVLLMSRPHKHPRTGIYWFRKRVPADLVSVVGRNEVTQSLNTRDPAEAKRRYADVLREHEARWENLRRGERNLTEREAHGLASDFYERWIVLHKDDPSSELLWHPEHYSALWTFIPLHEEQAEPGKPGTRPIENIFVPAMRRFCLEQADNALEHFGFEASYWNRLVVAKAIATATQRAHFVLKRQSEGVFDPGDEPALPAAQPAGSNQKFAPAAAPGTAPLTPNVKRGAITLTGLVESWWREAQAAGRKPSTYESYRNTFANLVRFSSMMMPRG